MYIIIACIGKNNELGLNNDLVFHIKEDLEFFKKTTYNHYILMGRKTLESLPKKLDGRKYLVISSSLESNEYPIFKSIKDVLKFKTDEDIYVIGGESIYKEMIKYSDKIILTIVDKSVKADKYFPSFNIEEYDSTVLGEYTSNDLKYTRKIYTRKKEV